MSEAIVLIETESGPKIEEDTYTEVELEEVFGKIADLEEVKSAAEVTGPYDIIAWLEADDVEHITEELVKKIRTFPGVADSLTNIVVKSK